MTITHHGDLDIYSEMTVSCTVSGRIIVHPNGILVLMGRAEGGVVVGNRGFARIPGTTANLFVQAGGHAVLTGTCEGDAICEGGVLTVLGKLQGEMINIADKAEILPLSQLPDPHAA